MLKKMLRWSVVVALLVAIVLGVSSGGSARDRSQVNDDGTITIHFDPSYPPSFTEGRMVSVPAGFMGDEVLPPGPPADNIGLIPSGPLQRYESPLNSGCNDFCGTIFTP